MRTVPLDRGNGLCGLDVVEHQLRFVAGPQRGEERVVRAPTVSLGTAAHNVVVLTDDTVSGHHCEIVVRGGRVVLRDLGSTNGTRLAGVEITEAFLAPGMEIALGETVIRYSLARSFEPVEASAAEVFGELWGSSAAMREVFGMLERVAGSELTCLLLGETGTGKELAARSIHQASARADGPFVVVDCGAMNPNLIEAELFGHERGAFTGADRARPGCFELAHQGTVFLDEIGELPHELQPRLLRVLERRESKRLGGHTPVPLDVRVVAATHRSLHEMVGEGTFRDDLYYRLSEVTVSLPPLCERTEDLPLLVSRMLTELGRSDLAVTPDAIAAWAAESWPGNVRQLRNAVRRAATFATAGVIDAALLATLPPSGPPTRTSEPPGAGGLSIAVRSELSLKLARAEWLEPLERSYLAAVVRRFGDDHTAAAAHVGMHKKSYARLLRRHGLAD